jgi:hypothetical protein
MYGQYGPQSAIIKQDCGMFHWSDGIIDDDAEVMVSLLRTDLSTMGEVYDDDCCYVSRRLPPLLDDGDGLCALTVVPGLSETYQKR